jgi:hypothetical protein
MNAGGAPAVHHALFWVTMIFPPFMLATMPRTLLYAANIYAPQTGTRQNAGRIRRCFQFPVSSFQFPVSSFQFSVVLADNPA